MTGGLRMASTESAMNEPDLRRFCMPRYDRRICNPGPVEERPGLPPHGAKGGKDLARVRRPGVPGMHWRRREDGKAYVVPAERQAETEPYVRLGGPNISRQRACAEISRSSSISNR